MAKLIAQTYGQALYELALESDKTDAFLEEAVLLKEVFSSDDDLMLFMKHPQVTVEEKKKVIEDALKGRLSDDMTGFVLIIIDKDRFSEIIEILDYFITSVKALKGIGGAKVATPLALSDDQKIQVKNKLLTTTGFKEMEIEYEVDSSLIGGMVIRIGDRVVDSSVKTRLYELKKDLLKIRLQN